MEKRSISLTPEQQARLKRLHLTAQNVIDGVQKGLHQSVSRGVSTTFSQNREYVAGDDIKHLDWHIMARSDKNILREYEEETDFCIYFILDTSASMGYGGANPKIHYASEVIAALSFIALQQKDQFALGVQNEDSSKILLRPSRGKQHWKELCHQLVNLEPKGEVDICNDIGVLQNQIQQRSLVIWVSDFICSPQECIKSIKGFTNQSYDLWALRILDHDEINFPFEKLTEFIGLECGQALKTNPQAIRRSYLKEFNDHALELRNLIRSEGCVFERLTTNIQIVENIFKTLATNNSRKR